MLGLSAMSLAGLVCQRSIRSRPKLAVRKKIGEMSWRRSWFGTRSSPQSFYGSETTKPPRPHRSTAADLRRAALLVLRGVGLGLGGLGEQVLRDERGSLGVLRELHRELRLALGR